MTSYIRNRSGVLVPKKLAGFIQPSIGMLTGKKIPPLVIVSGPQITGYTGINTSVSLQATGGMQPYVWGVDPATPLPSGTTISNGAMSFDGTTPLGTTQCTLKVVDAQNRIATRSISITISVQTYESVIMSSTPRAYWPSNEVSGTVCVDYTGSGFNGTYASGVTRRSIALRPGSLGSIYVPTKMCPITTPNTGLAANAAYSLEGIFMPTSNLSNSTLIGNSGTYGGPTAPGLMGGLYGGKFATQAHINSSGALYVAATANAYHAVMVYTGTQALVYVNGSLVSTNTLTGVALAALNIMGSSQYPSSYGLIGYGSDFAFYDRVLTAAEILQHATKAGLTYG